MAAISEYNQTMWEDDNKNRMHDSLELFDDVCNSPHFDKTSMILFLNKYDLFERKIKQVPLSVCFPEMAEEDVDISDDAKFGGTLYPQRCMEYIKVKFRAMNKSDMKKVYTHFTTATDKNNCKVVFDAVRDICYRSRLRAAELL